MLVQRCLLPGLSKLFELCVNNVLTVFQFVLPGLWGKPVEEKMLSIALILKTGHLEKRPT